MNDRETIFSALKAALEPLPQRTAYPEYADSFSVSAMADTSEHGEADPLLELFKQRVLATNARFVAGLEALAQCLSELGVKRGYIDPQLLEILPPCFAGFSLETVVNRDRIDSYEFGMTPASGAIAETGTVILRDADTPYRLGALAPWTHVAVLRRADLLPNVATAVLDMGNDPSVVWVTGPSKTADIEGIMIQGVHGPGCQICCLI